MHRYGRRMGLRVVGVIAWVGVLLAVAPAGAITYGTIDTGHPYVGAIIADLSHVRPDIGIIEWCSGTLIAPRVFLTAGHCTRALDAWQVPLDRIWVSFADNIWAKPSSWKPIETYVTHPDYWWGPTSDPHDVGVVILAKAVRGIGLGQLAPLGLLDALHEERALASTTFINVGYGSDENGVVDGWRKISYSSFMNLHDAWLYMSQNPHTGDAGTCYGDSGGPTFVNVGGTEVVVAVTSWGDAQCTATNLNYRVDTPSSQSFLGDMVAAYA